MTLTMAEPKRVVDGTIAEARKRNAEIRVTVCNAEGRLIALNRMDGAMAEAHRGSIGKAIAAAPFGRPSDAAEASAGVPLRTGKVEGGCGIDGASNGEEDEACARAGLAALGIRLA